MYQKKQFNLKEEVIIIIKACAQCAKEINANQGLLLVSVLHAQVKDL